MSFAGAVLASLVAAFVYASLTRGEAPGHTVVVSNQRTNGPTMVEDEQPLVLSTEPVNFCAQAHTCVPGVALHTGDTVVALCQHPDGQVATNGNPQDPGDDVNPGLSVSTRWYKVRWHDVVGYVAEVWLREDARGGLGLPSC